MAASVIRALQFQLLAWTFIFCVLAIVMVTDHTARKDWCPVGINPIDCVSIVDSPTINNQ